MSVVPLDGDNMVWCVTKAFRDWDGCRVEKGAIAETLVARGSGYEGKRFFNLIHEGRVVAVTSGAPPVEQIERPVQKRKGAA